MSTQLSVAADVRAHTINKSLARHGIVFAQCGAIFSPLREKILEAVPGERMTAHKFLTDGTKGGPSALIIDALEELTSPPGSPNLSLGSLREQVFGQVDAGRNVCLMSRAPRIAFAPIPGSSLLEDAALCILPLLTLTECPEARREEPAWRLPAVAFASEVNVLDIFRSAHVTL